MLWWLAFSVLAAAAEQSDDLANYVRTDVSAESCMEYYEYESNFKDRLYKWRQHISRRLVALGNG